MVLRLDSVRARLVKLEEIITRLSELSADDSAQGDFRQTWAVERGLQLGSELLLDIGHHILVAHFGIAPADYADILVQLARAGVISDELRLRLKGLAGSATFWSTTTCVLTRSVSPRCWRRRRRTSVRLRWRCGSSWRGSSRSNRGLVM